MAQMRIEPEVVEVMENSGRDCPDKQEVDGAIVSIAVSLRRIADLFESVVGLPINYNNPAMQSIHIWREE